MKAIPVPPEDLDGWFARVLPFLKELASDGAWNVDDFMQQLRRKERQLWVAYDGEVKAVMLTAIGTDHHKTCRITHCTGKHLQEWLDLLPVVAGWAKEMGCERLEPVARRGWERVLKKFGFRATHVVLELRL